MYSQMPKQLIHDNAIILVVFKQDDLNLYHVYHDHVNTDMKYDTFKHMNAEQWKDGYGFLILIKDSPTDTVSYRIGFDRLIIQNDV